MAFKRKSAIWKVYLLCFAILITQFITHAKSRQFLWIIILCSLTVRILIEYLKVEHFVVMKYLYTCLDAYAGQWFSQCEAMVNVYKLCLNIYFVVKVMISFNYQFWCCIWDTFVITKINIGQSASDPGDFGEVRDIW